MYHDRIRVMRPSASGTVGTPANPRAWVPTPQPPDADPAGDVLFQCSCCVQDDVETVRKAAEATQAGRESTPADALVFLPRPIYRSLLRTLDDALGRERLFCLLRRIGDEHEVRAEIIRTSRTDGTVLVRIV